MNAASEPPNPWTALPDAPPFVLADDRERLRPFAEAAKPEHRFDFSILPEPFVGRADAPVVLLGLNPGFDPRDAETHARPAFAAALRANLCHEPLEFPFYLLNPKLPSPGRDWWSRRLRPLVEGTDLHSVAKNVLCVEYFPYHSVNFARRTPRVPSQRYSTWLVEAAVARGAHIVLMRGEWAWLPSVPSLRDYAHLHRLGNPQSPYVSRKNCPHGFDLLLRAIARDEGSTNVERPSRSDA